MPQTSFFAKIPFVPARSRDALQNDRFSLQVVAFGLWKYRQPVPGFW
jgi:hypothetical protein